MWKIAALKRGKRGRLAAPTPRWEWVCRYPTDRCDVADHRGTSEPSRTA